MRLQRLTLENYRGFASLELELTGQTTVLVGVNGSGKSSVLDAIAALMDRLRGRIGLAKVERSLSFRDLRAGHERCRIAGEFVWDEAPVAGHEDLSLWVSLDAKQGRAKSPTSSEGEKVERFWSGELKAGRSPSVPLLAEFSISRYFSAPQEAKPSRMPATPLEFYAHSPWEGRLSNRDELLEWYRLREDFENEMFRDRRDYVDPQLDAIRRAIASFMPGYKDLRVRRRPTRETGAEHLDVELQLGPAFTLRKGDTLLFLHQLSDGEQGMLVLVGDLARRLAITHPGLADPLQGSGIVLIDEIELHLHPQWQRTVIPSLERTFPNLQFIVTTHSPQVLSLVPREQVVLLRDFQRVEHTPHTRGRDSNAILYEVMGVEQYPPFAAEKVQAVARLIDAERWDEARAALAALAADFGPNDVEVVRLGSMLEFMRDDEAAG